MSRARPPSLSHSPLAGQPADRGEVSRRRIYDALFRELAERGFASLRVAAIARRAGVSRGRFYHHFRSIDDAVARAYRVHTSGTVRYVSEALARGARVEDAIVGDLVRLLRSTPRAMVRAMVELRMVAFHDPAIRDVLVADYRRKLREAARAIRAGIRTGELRRNLDPEWEAHRIYTGCFGIYLQSLAAGDRADLAGQVERHVRGLFCAMRA